MTAVAVHTCPLCGKSVPDRHATSHRRACEAVAWLRQPQPFAPGAAEALVQFVAALRGDKQEATP